MIADRWGATDREVATDRPCDRLVTPGAGRADRAISIAAPVGLVFRWLCQLRAAPYSYDWIDNGGKPSPRALTPGLEDLAIGERFMRIFTLRSYAPDEHITLHTSGRTAVSYCVAVEPGGSRLAVRIRMTAPRFLAAPMLIGDLVMMRRQLLTLKDRAEQGRSPINASGTYGSRS